MSCRYFSSMSYFKTGFFVFLVFSFPSSLYLLETNPLADVYIGGKDFLPFCRLPLQPVTSSLCSGTKGCCVVKYGVKVDLASLTLLPLTPNY